MNLVELSLQIATEAHRGQKRRDGVTDYVTHPIAVQEKVKGWIDETIRFLKQPINSKDVLGIDYYYFSLVRDAYLIVRTIPLNIFSEICQAVSLQHDQLEDCGEKFGILFIRNKFKEHNIPDNIIEIVLGAVEILTKTKNECYLNYIRRVKSNPIARIVKIADIEHNLSSKPKEKNIDKYQLARYILLN